ncbi:hypothetical protein KM043_016426 [Ampulex compressa]|nr:hypothetical protein KM043_016426 [Ampulex compressa]
MRRLIPKTPSEAATGKVVVRPLIIGAIVKSAWHHRGIRSPQSGPRPDNKSGPSVGNWVHSLRSIRYCLPRVRPSIHSPLGSSPSATPPFIPAQRAQTKSCDVYVLTENAREESKTPVTEDPADCLIIFVTLHQDVHRPAALEIPSLELRRTMPDTYSALMSFVANDPGYSNRVDPKN